MSPPDRPDRGLEVRRLAAAILERVEERRGHATALLESRESELSDRRDRALLHEIVLGVLRRRPAIDHALRVVSSRPLRRIDPPVLRTLRIGMHSLLFLDRVPDFAVVDTSVELVRFLGFRSAAGFVNGILRRAARNREGLACPAPRAGDVGGLARFTGHPEWWTAKLVQRLGWADAGELLRANGRPAPTVVRPARGIAVAELARRLETEGVETEPGRFASGALRVVRGAPQGTRVFAEGFAYIQDEASQLVVRLFGERRCRSIADLCAAPGGKTLQMADEHAAGRPIVAVDRSPRRLRRLAHNAVRLGLRDRIAPVAADLERSLPLAARAFERVLLDAPCSGTGTLRRHPEIRWRLSAGDVRRLARIQARLLASASELVAPGGVLVYAVCSMEPEEGPEVVEAFLVEHPSFEREDAAAWLPATARPLVAADGSLRTSPAEGGLDGFHAARLRRAP